MVDVECSSDLELVGEELSAPSGGRTHTWRILSPLPLPLGYRGAMESRVYRLVTGRLPRKALR